MESVRPSYSSPLAASAASAPSCGSAASRHAFDLAEPRASVRHTEHTLRTCLRMRGEGDAYRCCRSSSRNSMLVLLVLL